MSSLVPEKRLDKNNRLVTRHVRSNDADTPLAPIPAPKIATRAPSNACVLKLRQDVIEAVEDYDVQELMDGGARYHFLGGTHFLDERTALLAKEAITTPEMSALCFYLLGDYSDQMTDVREVLFYRDAIPLTKETTTFNLSDECIGMTRGIHAMKEFENCKDLSALPEDQVKQVSALIQVGYGILSSMGAQHPSLAITCKHGLGSRYPLTITDPDLIRLIMDHPEHAETFCSVIESRKTVDIGLLRESMRNASVLASGAL